jgi:hypothetical protein
MTTLSQQSRCVLLGDPVDGSVYCRIESEPLLRARAEGTVFMFPALEPATIYAGAARMDVPNRHCQSMEPCQSFKP